MGLPTIPKKQFEIKSKFLPKGKIVLTPFSVGQEDYLIQVKDADTEKEKIDAVKQMIEECIITNGVDIKTLPLFMIEEIFLRLFQNSSSELIDLAYECSGKTEDDKDCKNRINLQVDLREFKLVEHDGHTNTILVSDPIGMKFKYPSLDMYDNGFDLSAEKDAIISCIESIFDSENVYPAEDSTVEELKSFWNQLTLKQKKEVFDKFFNTMPNLHYKTQIKCPKCGKVHDIEFNSVMEVFI